MNTSQMTDHLLTDRDLADRYGKSLYFVQQRSREQAWPHLRVGKSIRFTQAHVDAIDALLEVPVTTAPAPTIPQPSADNPWGRKGRRRTHG